MPPKNAVMCPKTAVILSERSESKDLRTPQNTVILSERSESKDLPTPPKTLSS